MQLMNSSDFERVLAHWQVNPEDPKGPTFTTSPGVCWIRGYDDFPSITELKAAMFIDHSKADTRNYDFDTALPSFTEQEDESNFVADELILALQKSAVTGVTMEADLDRGDVWIIACEKDWRTGLNRYLLYSEGGNIAFRDMGSAQDIARNIFLAQLVRENFMYDDFSSEPEGSNYSWDYRVMQATCPEELGKLIEDLGYLRGKTSEAWFLCTHVVNQILSLTIFVVRNNQLVKQVVFCEPTSETCCHMDPLVMLFWRVQYDKEEGMPLP